MLLFEAEVPGDALGPVLAALGGLGAAAVEPAPGPGGWTIKGEIPAGRAREAEAALPALARGEGTWWSEPSGERRVTAPSRPRTGADPLDRAAYLRHLNR
ncbi:hypothetical protein F8568_039690 [Actinomadura sp. LD22]|uniref:Uncharacterized protein n=1 Tax=Actinomadura physcomitrii TaxID=2650748 RepID=A0A6I4MVK8_9ACTN|nr:hypothetical protein [Actinomadura physcomitrii]MWA06366.1 hypothetical protein [Actinomadura physcomitrii]